MSTIFGMTFEVLAVMIAVMVPIGIILAMMIMNMMSHKKVLILYFFSEHLAGFMEKKLWEGGIHIGKKLISVDGIKPVQFKTKTMLFVKVFKPMYCIKHNKAVPMEFTDKGIKMMSGENLQNLTENKTLDSLLQPKEDNKKMLLYLAMGIGLGLMGGYILAQSLIKK